MDFVEEDCENANSTVPSEHHPNTGFSICSVVLYNSYLSYYFRLKKCFISKYLVPIFAGKWNKICYKL